MNWLKLLLLCSFYIVLYSGKCGCFIGRVLQVKSCHLNLAAKMCRRREKTLYLFNPNFLIVWKLNFTNALYVAM